MKIQSLIAFFFAVISVGLCQKPTPCVTPQQWEARYFEYDNKNGEETRARIFYDSLYKRERIIEEYTIGGQQNFYDILYLHSEKVQYVYDLKEKNCTKQTIDREWRNFGIPQNATSLGESYIGSGAIANAGVLTTIWQDTFQDDKGNQVNYLGVWTLEGCFPVSIVINSPNGGVDRHVFFLDLTLGIENPNIFFPRPECLNA